MVWGGGGDKESTLLHVSTDKVLVPGSTSIVNEYLTLNLLHPDVRLRNV